MRSVKGIIIGFLLIPAGLCRRAVQPDRSRDPSAGGLAAVVVSALPKRAEKQEPQAAPAAPVPAPAELSAPELLPDILTDPPVQPKIPPLPQPEAEALYKTLADAYTRIDALSCRGPAWMLERDIRLCKAFCARWDSAKADAQTAAILREKARFVEYSNEFLLPGFGRHGRIPSRRTSGDLLEDLSAAVLKQAAQQQAALEAALRGQKWFEGVKKQLRPIQPGLGRRACAGKEAGLHAADTAALTRKTAPGISGNILRSRVQNNGQKPLARRNCAAFDPEIPPLCAGIRADRLRKPGKWSDKIRPRGGRDGTHDAGRAEAGPAPARR